MYFDVLMSSEDCFYLNVPHCMVKGVSGYWERDALARCTEGLVSLLLALQKRPIIRYSSHSQMSFQLARSVQVAIKYSHIMGVACKQSYIHFGLFMIVFLFLRTSSEKSGSCSVLKKR